MPKAYDENEVQKGRIYPSNIIKIQLLPSNWHFTTFTWVYNQMLLFPSRPPYNLGFHNKDFHCDFKWHLSWSLLCQTPFLLSSCNISLNGQLAFSFFKATQWNAPKKTCGGALGKSLETWNSLGFMRTDCRSVSLSYQKLFYFQYCYSILKYAVGIPLPRPTPEGWGGKHLKVMFTTLFFYQHQD